MSLKRLIPLLDRVLVRFFLVYSLIHDYGTTYKPLWFISRSSDWLQRPKLVECNATLASALSIMLHLMFWTPTHLFQFYPWSRTKQIEWRSKIISFASVSYGSKLFYLHLPDCYFNWTWSSRPWRYVWNSARALFTDMAWYPIAIANS